MIGAIAIAALIVLVVLLFFWIDVEEKSENYGICRGCGPQRDYQLAVLNPFAYPYSGTTDEAWFSRQNNLEPPVVFPQKVPPLIPDIPLTQLRSPDHALLVGYDGGGYY